jgi:hypothetical protein
MKIFKILYTESISKTGQLKLTFSYRALGNSIKANFSQTEHLFLVPFEEQQERWTSYPCGLI